MLPSSLKSCGSTTRLLKTFSSRSRRTGFFSKGALAFHDVKNVIHDCCWRLHSRGFLRQAMCQRLMRPDRDFPGFDRWGWKWRGLSGLKIRINAYLQIVIIKSTSRGFCPLPIVAVPIIRTAADGRFQTKETLHSTVKNDRPVKPMRNPLRKAR